MPLFGSPSIEKLKANKDIKGLINAMNDGLKKPPEDFEKCQAAAKVLGELKASQAVEPLIKVLLSGDHNSYYMDLRQAVSAALGEIGDPRAEEPLINVLKDTKNLSEPFLGEYRSYTPKVRIAAREALQKLRAVDLLINALRDENRDVQYDAAIALGIIGDPKAVEPLITVVQDNEEDSVCAQAINALERINDIRAVDVLIRALDVNIHQADQHRKVSYWVANDAARTLGELGDQKANEPLLAMLLDKNTDYRLLYNIEVSLGKLKEKRAFEPLIAMLEHPESIVVIGAIDALASFRDERAVEPLIAKLKSPDGSIQIEAVRMLGRMSDKRALPALEAIAMDKNQFKIPLTELNPVLEYLRKI
jgi:HEAT repeat protein